MAKDTIGIGVNSVARLMDAGWIGVNNVAREIDEVWIGDENGKAQIVWKDGIDYLFKGIVYCTNSAGTGGMYLTKRDGTTLSTEVKIDTKSAFDICSTRDGLYFVIYQNSITSSGTFYAYKYNKTTGTYDIYGSYCNTSAFKTDIKADAGADSSDGSVYFADYTLSILDDGSYFCVMGYNYDYGGFYLGLYKNTGSGFEYEKMVRLPTDNVNYGGCSERCTAISKNMDTVVLHTRENHYSNSSKSYSYMMYIFKKTENNVSYTCLYRNGIDKYEDDDTPVTYSNLNVLITDDGDYALTPLSETVTSSVRSETHAYIHHVTNNNSTRLYTLQGKNAADFVNIVKSYDGKNLYISDREKSNYRSTNTLSSIFCLHVSNGTVTYLGSITGGMTSSTSSNMGTTTTINNYHHYNYLDEMEGDYALISDAIYGHVTYSGNGGGSSNDIAATYNTYLSQVSKDSTGLITAFTTLNTISVPSSRRPAYFIDKDL